MNKSINEGEETNLPYGIPNSLCRYFPVKKKLTLPWSCVWPGHSDFPSKSTACREGEQMNLTMETPGEPNLARWSWSTVMSRSVLDVMQMAYDHCGLPKVPQPQSDHKKNRESIPVEEYLIKYLTGMSHSFPNHKKQGKSETFPAKRHMETRWLNAVF